MLDTDTLLMKRALELARKGAGLVSPNPMVGAVLVNDGRVVGEGFHRYDLLKHAESYAIAAAGETARGATLYCNLEPCCHHGRTPPCTNALIEAEIARAVIATKDADPRVNGRGIEQLREAGIEVEVGVLEDRARQLNESYFKFITTGSPFVHGVIEYPTGSDGLFEWNPSAGFVGAGSKYDAVLLGNRSEINYAIVDQALLRERHRPLVIVGGADLPESLTSKVDIVLVPFDANPVGVGSGNVVALDEGIASDIGKSSFGILLTKLARLDVTSLLCLPGGVDLSNTDEFSLVDKVTLAVPGYTIESGFATRWSFADLEFDLEDVRIEKAGSFAEITGLPSLQEVA
jgi:pyrimidine deaminase RibD-like protein